MANAELAQAAGITTALSFKRCIQQSVSLTSEFEFHSFRFGERLHSAERNVEFRPVLITSILFMYHLRLLAVKLVYWNYDHHEIQTMRCFGKVH